VDCIDADLRNNVAQIDGLFLPLLFQHLAVYVSLSHEIISALYLLLMCLILVPRTHINHLLHDFLLNRQWRDG